MIVVRRLKEMFWSLLLEPFVGKLNVLERHRILQENTPSLTETLNNIRTKWGIPEEFHKEEPLFILSAGFRSGSTLLQRLVLSCKKWLIWGEPYGTFCPILLLSQHLQCIREDLLPSNCYIDNLGEDKPLERMWVANLYPNPRFLIQSQRQCIRELLAIPAQKRGYESWGLKEVRLGIEQASYLKLLFPGSRFLFIYRNPYDAYRSYSSFEKNWYLQWPDKPVFTPSAFGKHWKTLTEGFIKDVDSVGGLLIRYEDLIAGQNLIEDLALYLGALPDPEVLKSKQKGGKHKSIDHIPFMERLLLSREVEPLASELGYTPDN